MADVCRAQVFLRGARPEEAGSRGMEIQAQYAIAGLVVGILVGLTGMGGGAIMAPMLILIFKIQPVVAVGTDLVFMAATKLVGAWRHQRLGNVDHSLVKLLAMGSIPGALAGMLLIWQLPNGSSDVSDVVITRLMAAVLVLVGMSLLVLRKVRQSSSSTPVPSNRRMLIPVVGAIIGFLVATTSVGSGSLFLVLMLAVYTLPMRRYVGTDVFHGFFLVVVAGLAHIGLGNVDFSLVVNLLIGSVPGVIIGTALTTVLSERKMGTVVAFALVGIGVKLML